ncbi:hypothetical protein GCM10027568_30420 [Humibacter soli]
MNTQTLETLSSATTEPRAERQTRNSHPPSPLDRLAMRAGLALILWSRREERARRTLDRELTSQRNSAERDRLAREHTWQTSVHSLTRR